MIAVVADDLTGAAELAGIAWSRGLKAEVSLNDVVDSHADVIAIDTDSRSCSEQEAAERVYRTGSALHSRAPAIVFKKIDSVLRGHIVAETKALMRSLHLPRALLVPGNPQRQRFLRDGHFYVQGKLIHQTEFASDPDFPARTSEALELLRVTGASEVRMLTGTNLPAQGVVVAEATTAGELMEWCQRLSEDTLPVGSAEFFGCFLEKHGFRGTHGSVCEAPNRNKFFICGSASAATRAFIAKAKTKGLPVFSSMELAEAPNRENRLSNLRSVFAEAIKSAGCIILAIDQPLQFARGAAEQLCAELVQVADQVLALSGECDIYIEGGATAAAFVMRKGWTRLQVVGQLAPGVVTMQPLDQNLRITIKPGSYPWPEHLL